MMYFRTSALLAGLVSGALGAGLRPGFRAVPPPVVDLNVGTSASATSAEAETALWAGSDAVPYWYMDNLTAASVGNVSADSTLGVTRFSAIHIAGMFDSGTNLLAATMKLNFPDFAQLFSRGDKEGSDRPWWKHTPPVQNEGYMNSRTLLIQMVRSPLAQITAWSKAGYDLGICADIYDIPCNIRGVPYPGGVTDVWNTYTEGFDHAAIWHDNAMVVEYEELVMEPEKVMGRIADKLGRKLPWHVQIVGEPAKNHGKPAGRQAAMAKIQDMTYLSAPHLESSTTRRSLCQKLNKDVMSGHRIPSSPRRMYSADCQQ